MSTVILFMSMSLDGFIAGPDDDLDLLHEWSYPKAGASTRSDVSREALEELFASAATVMGRRTFDLGDRRNGWAEKPPFQTPIFIPSHSVLEKAAPNLTFVTDGVVSAVKQAQAVAGDGIVTIIGGANVFQQALEAGLVDELLVHLVPVVLGEGIRLFDNLRALPVKLEVARVIDTPEVTHLKYRVLGNNR